jgi:hypothetical protein
MRSYIVALLDIKLLTFVPEATLLGPLTLTRSNAAARSSWSTLTSALRFLLVFSASAFDLAASAIA